MNPLHSPRNEHSTTDFGNKNSEKKIRELETFSGSKLVLRPALHRSPGCLSRPKIKRGCISVLTMT